MRKIKELLLFLIVLLVPVVLFLVASGNVLSDQPHFVGASNYLRLFLHDQIFVKALLNTIAIPVLCVSVFAVLVCLLRKKIKTPRVLFYMGSVLIGSIASLAHVVYISITLFGVPKHLYASEVLVSLTGDLQMSLWDVLSVGHILSALYIGVFTAFVFWILEQIVDAVKIFRRKRTSDERE